MRRAKATPVAPVTPATPPLTPRRVLVGAGVRLTSRLLDLGRRLDAGEPVWNEYLETIAAVESVANAQHLGLASPPGDPAAWEKVGREWTRVARMAKECAASWARSRR